ncbi:hypothetical protein, partial [Gallibacterium anatis]
EFKNRLNDERLTGINEEKQTYFFEVLRTELLPLAQNGQISEQDLRHCCKPRNLRHITTKFATL